MRVVDILKEMVKQCEADPDMEAMYQVEVNTMLNMLNEEDCFGTEGQNDPRGDGRDD
jgi:hypothetical protein